MAEKEKSITAHADAVPTPKAGQVVEGGGPVGGPDDQKAEQPRQSKLHKLIDEAFADAPDSFKKRLAHELRVVSITTPDDALNNPTTVRAAFAAALDGDAFDLLRVARGQQSQ